MKTKKYLAFASFFALSLMTGCGETSSSVKASDTSASQSRASEVSSAVSSAASSQVASTSEEEYTGYSVTVYYPDGTTAKAEDEISVQWCDEQTCKTPVQIDDHGVAKNPKLTDGNYSVHLLDLPEQYTYNPNIYTTSAENKQIDVYLVSVKGTIAPEYDDNGVGIGGTGYNTTNGIYNITEDGVYNITISGKDQLAYFSLNQNSSTQYYINSWARYDTFVDNIDPYLNCYDTDKTTVIHKEDGDKANFSYESTATGTMVYGVGLNYHADMDDKYSGYFPMTFALQITSGSSNSGRP